MRAGGVSAPCPCQRLEDSSAIWGSCSALLRAKSAALLEAGKQQLVQRCAYMFLPQADATSAACFFPLQQRP